MARPTAAAIVAARRLKVAQLSLRGLSQREIVAALKNQRIVNPKTGESYSLGTVNSDLQALEAEWDEAALEARSKKKARITAELQELKRAAYADRDFRLVGEIIKQERALYSLDDPIELNLKGQIDHEHTHKIGHETAVDEMDEGDLDQLISNLLVVVNAQANLPEQLVEGEVIDVDKYMRRW